MNLRVSEGKTSASGPDGTEVGLFARFHSAAEAVQVIGHRRRTAGGREANS